MPRACPDAHCARNAQSSARPRQCFSIAGPVQIDAGAHEAYTVPAHCSDSTYIHTMYSANPQTWQMGVEAEALSLSLSLSLPAVRLQMRGKFVGIRQTITIVRVPVVSATVFSSLKREEIRARRPGLMGVARSATAQRCTALQ